jgi:pantoate--beta-alanine ligase
VSVGFVPTMGALHVGHGSLVERSKRENDITVVSIFVNPTQFNCSSDYSNYPNTIESDLAQLEALGVDYVFLPTETTMYPDKKSFVVTVNNECSQQLEGCARPGHFNGVMTVVLKLLNIIDATRAYFGEKDYQQLSLVRSLVEAFFLSVEIIGCPTVRLPSKLPYSSRNARLSDEKKEQADKAAKIIHATTYETLEQSKAQLASLGIVVDYLSSIENRIFSAIKIGNIRLIDNFAIGE